MKLPWPEITSSRRPDETIRGVLDYLAWIGLELTQSDQRVGPDREIWRQRVQRAYRALFLPPVTGHGDPYPPDVPPPRNPGRWPDIPSAGVPGMTVRHQLKVIRLLVLDLRDHLWPHGRAPQFQEWDRRLCQAREALDLGSEVEVPEEARTSTSPEVLAEAKAQEAAKRNLQRRRERAMKRIQTQARRKKSQAKTRTKPPRGKKKAPARKKAAPKKKKPVARKKAAAKKKKPAATKKATPKTRVAAKKKAAPKKKAVPQKKKAAPKKKAGTKKSARARAAKAKTTRKKPASTKRKR